MFEHDARSIKRATRLACAIAMLATTIGACSRTSGPEPVKGDRAFTLVYSESNLGNIEPCSCNNRTVGGFPRRASLLADVRGKSPAVLVLDGGNSLVSEHIESGPAARQARVKAEAIAQAFVRTGLDAMVFGDLDLRLGSEFFLDLVKRTNLPVIAANVKDRKTGDTLFPPYKIVDFDGLRVAVLGLCAQELHPLISEINAKGSRHVAANTKKTVVMAELFEGSQVKIDDPVETAAAWIPRLREQAHFVVVLSHLPQKVLRDLSSKVAGIDCIVGSHAPIAQRATYQIEGNTLLLTAPINGTNLGIVDFSVKDGSLLFSDRTPIERARELIPIQQKFLDDIVKQFGTDDVEVVRTRSPELAVKLEKLKGFLAQQAVTIRTADAETGSYFVQRNVNLDGIEYQDEPAMHAFVRDYRRGLSKIYEGQTLRPSQLLEKTPGARFYVKAEGCTGCHMAQTEFWRNTPHGHAWDTMVREEATADVECIGCHTVAWLRPNGFDRPDQVAGYENVQCENCHGPGSVHSRGGGFIDPGSIIGDADAMNCEECHNSQHSPGFRRDTYVPRASCPPIDPNEPVIRGVYGRVASELVERTATDKSTVAPFIALIEVYLRLEQPDRALAVADRALAIFPAALRLKAGKARALDGIGRSHEALDLLAELQEGIDTNTDDPPGDAPSTSDPAAGEANPAEKTAKAGQAEKKNGGNAKVAFVLRESIELLLKAKDVSARNAEAALELADWAINAFGARDPVFYRQKAEALRALGQIDAAIALLQETQETKDKLTHQFERILGDLRAEREAIRDFTTPPPLAVPPTPK